MYVRCSETFLNVFWTSDVWSLYTLFRGEQLYHWLPKKVIHVQRQQWKRRWICRIFFKAKGNAKRQSVWSSLMLFHSFLLKKRLRLKPLFQKLHLKIKFWKVYSKWDRVETKIVMLFLYIFFESTLKIKLTVD